MAPLIEIYSMFLCIPEVIWKSACIQRFFKLIMIKCYRHYLIYKNTIFKLIMIKCYRHYLIYKNTILLLCSFERCIT